MALGFQSIPSPVAARDVVPLIAALKALAQRHFLPAAGSTRVQEAAKAAADGKELLASPNYFVWALGAYETVAYGRRAEAVKLLAQLVKTRPPIARVRSELRLPVTTETIRPILSLRRATQIFYLFTRSRVPRGNRVPPRVIAAYFLQFLRTYELPDKGRYIPMSPSSFDLFGHGNAGELLRTPPAEGLKR